MQELETRMGKNVRIKLIRTVPRWLHSSGYRATYIHQLQISEFKTSRFAHQIQDTEPASVIYC